jgi:hypothetical protein
MSRLERNPRKLLQEMDVRIRLRDIRHLHDMRERASMRWWEPIVLVFLFVSAFGLLFVLVQGIESRPGLTSSELLIARFLYAWVGLFVVALTLMLELLLTRLRALRRLSQTLTDELVRQHKRLERLEARLNEPLSSPPPADTSRTPPAT